MSELQIEVRWRPEETVINLNLNHDKAFRGEKFVVLAESVAYIERNYLTFTTIKHPDRAESTRVWNFDLAEIGSALAQVAMGQCSKGGLLVWVDIGYRAVVISSSGELPIVRVPANPLTKSLRQGAGQVSQA